MAACEFGQLKILEYMCNHGGQISAELLCRATDSGCLACVRYLLEHHRFSVKWLTQALHAAAAKGFLDIGLALVNGGADFKNEYVDGLTPMARAAAYGHLGFAKQWKHRLKLEFEIRLSSLDKYCGYYEEHQSPFVDHLWVMRVCKIYGIKPSNCEVYDRIIERLLRNEWLSVIAQFVDKGVRIPCGSREVFRKRKEGLSKRPPSRARPLTTLEVLSEILSNVTLVGKLIEGM
jgi:hypothetical protein